MTQTPQTQHAQRRITASAPRSAVDHPSASIVRREAVTPLLALLAALFLAAWLIPSAHRTLVRPDEGRYAEIAREMAASGDYVTPTLNGLKYFEKPPLQYWATALAIETVGLNNFTGRWWPAFTGLRAVVHLVRRSCPGWPRGCAGDHRRARGDVLLL